MAAYPGNPLQRSNMGWGWEAQTGYLSVDPRLPERAAPTRCPTLDASKRVGQRSLPITTPTGADLRWSWLSRSARVKKFLAWEKIWEDVVGVW